MPKKQGDRHKKTGHSFPDMIDTMVRDLSSADDPRFQRFWNYKPFPVYLGYLKNSQPVNCCCGANKAAKTTFHVWKAVMIYTGIVPPAAKGIYAKSVPLYRPRHVRIICQDYSKHWPETVRPLLLDDEGEGMLPKTWAQWDEGEHMFTGPDGSFLSIMSVDPKQQTDPNYLRGPLIDYTYIDEETTRVCFTESLARNASLPDGPAEVDLGWCPQSGKQHWQITDLYTRGYSIQDDRRLPEEDQDQGTQVIRVSMKDNPSIPAARLEEYARQFKPWEYAYRVEGKPSDRSEDPFFDMEILWSWQNDGRLGPAPTLYQCKEIEVDPENGVFIGKLELLRVTPKDKNAMVWKVWKLPENGRKYIVVEDGAEGKPNSDFHVIDVWDCTDRYKSEQVAQLRVKMVSPDLMAVQGLCMANVYGDCLFAYEENNTVGGIILEKSRYYPNVYTRPAAKQTAYMDDSERLGWHTDHVNKPAACHEAYGMVREWEHQYNGYVGVHSPDTVADMCSFQDRIEKNKAGDTVRVLSARAGAYDDCVTVLWIMSYVSRLQHHMLSEAVIDEEKEEARYDSFLENRAKDDMREGKRFGTLKKQPRMSKVLKSQGGRRHAT